MLICKKSFCIMFSDIMSIYTIRVFSIICLVLQCFVCVHANSTQFAESSCASRYGISVESARTNYTSEMIKRIAHTHIIPAALSSSPHYSVAKSIIPSLTGASYKGQHGKVVIIGGSFEYTGAPFYAGISALKAGADLVTVACTMEAAVPLKAYSPELIVHPVLASNSDTTVETSTSVDKLMSLLKRADSVVIGPGLGRDKATMDVLEQVFEHILHDGIPTVVDGDGLYMLATKPHLLTKAKSTQVPIILTPNGMEFKRLWSAAHGVPWSETEKMSEVPEIPADATEAAHALVDKLGKLTIIKKGSVDVTVSRDGSGVVEAGVEGVGSPRRCGGQGDVLAGLLGTFLSWAHKHNTTAADTLHATDTGRMAEKYAAAGFAASMLTRLAAQAAFAEHGRSTTTPDIIHHIGRAFAVAFDD